MNRGKLEKHSHEGDEDERGEQGSPECPVPAIILLLLTTTLGTSAP